MYFGKIKILVLFLLYLPVGEAHSQLPDDFLLKSVTDATMGEYFDFIHAFAPDEDAFVGVQRLAEPFVQKKQWESAAEIYEIWKPEFPNMTERFDKIITLLRFEDEYLVPVNLGSGINTAANEYSPIPTADESKLFFTGLNRDGKGAEDIYMSKYGNGLWQKAEKLTSMVNSKKNEAPEGISVDGTQLIIFGNYDESFGRGDLFYTDITKQGWNAPTPFPFPINTGWFDCDAKPTADGNAILFVSDRPGSIGGFHRIHQIYHGSKNGNTDIYISFKTDTGWSLPINLGPIVNTPYAERKPFLHPDMKSLYFSSEGHYGLGRMDIFKSVRLSEDSWTEWSEPVNMGRYINTAGDDWGAIVSTEGYISYFAASEREDSYGRTDIYAIKVPDSLRPEKVVTISGKVRDNEGNTIAADIIWEDLETGKQIGHLRSNPQDGSYFVVLPLGKNYGVYANKDGYYQITKNVDLRKDEGFFYGIYEDITIYNLKQLGGSNIRINNVFFEYDKWDLKPESYPDLDRLAELLKTIPEFQVEIAGHTDYIGGDDYNHILSEKRARSVVYYLSGKGINRDRLKPTGYGKTKPVVSNETDAGRAQNRRVEFKVIPKK